MGGLFGNSNNAMPNVPEPQKTAEPSEIGTQRKAEDKALFGGKPELKNPKGGVPKPVATGGTGLKVM